MVFSRFLISFLLLAGLLGITGSASGQSPPSAVTIQPFLQKISFAADEPRRTITVEVKNQTSTVYEFKAVAIDFGSLDETGGLIFAGSTSNELIAKYGLAKWLILDSSVKRLAPGASTTISASVDNRSDLSPGGHYAAIVLTSVDSSGQPADTAKVSLQKNIASLIFANKQGGEIYKLRLTNVKDNHSLFNFPDEVTLRFKNGGNTHLVPRGIVSVTAGDKLISKGIINESSAMVLPESTRQYTVNLRQLSSAYAAGNFSLKVDYRFDGFDNIRRYQHSFYVFTPLGTITVLLIISLVAGTAIFLLKKKGFRLPFLSVKKKH